MCLPTEHLPRIVQVTRRRADDRAGDGERVLSVVEVLGGHAQHVVRAHGHHGMPMPLKHLEIDSREESGHAAIPRRSRRIHLLEDAQLGFVDVLRLEAVRLQEPRG